MIENRKGMGKIESWAYPAKEIVEQIMTQHWDMKSCDCWICTEGRKAGLRPRENHLKIKKPDVIIDLKNKK